MGIPVGWNIVRDEAKEKDVLRADVIGSRSPIRRRARGSLPPRSLGRYTLGALLENAPRLPSPRLSQPRLSPLPPAPPVPELRAHDLERAPDLDRHHLPLPRPHSSSSASGSDSAREAADERPLPALTPGFAPAGLRPTSNRYAESVLLGTYARDHSHVDGHRGNTSNRGRLARTPSRGSPARAVSGRRTELDGLPYAQRRTVRNPFLENDTVSRAEDGGDDDGTARTTNAVSHPTLRRVGHRRIADGPLPSSHRESWSPVSTIDGLGDRERSNSVSSTSSHPAWQTFLHTVVPDPVAPTAESSFASSAASASFAASSSRASSSNSNSAASSLTHVTIPSRRPSAGAVRRRDEDTIEGLARACESSDEDDSTASDTDDEATANTLSRRRMRPSYFADEPPSPRRYGRSVMEQGIDARRYIRRYYSHERPPYRPWQMNGPAMSPEPEREERGQEADSFATTVVDDDTPPSTGLASPLDQELRDARNLLERLTRRGDVGDDFWASVGLTRSFADGVERVQERSRF